MNIYRLLAEAGSGFGVHIEYEDLYDFIVFIVSVYAMGRLAEVARMPNLVGQIFAGILLGPSLADFVPLPQAWVLLGEVGLVILVLEAGIDIDVATLKLIGTRGLLIALIGSILPIALGMALAVAVVGTSDVKAVIAAGATFGPTSLGIALNILRSGGILNTPVGQLIISAAVIDDMIALIILSQLESLVGTIDAASVLIPIVSAVAFLVIGGYIAIFWMPVLMNRFVLRHFGKESHGQVELYTMFAILLAMMPATFYAKASYLMGAFVAGLSFCTSHSLHEEFVRQYKRVLQWLMRIFFAASIGFQVPIKDFGQGKIIWQGLVFTGALLGKLAVGFMVPNFTQSRNFTGLHLRDCLITGFSMAAEGEFAFVIAVFAVDQGLIDKDLYASVVLAVLISTILPPFLLRFTISYYDKKMQSDIQMLADQEMERKHDLEADTVGGANLEDDILRKKVIFLCIQTQSESRWGLMLSMMRVMVRMGLDVIDHRSWHPRGINTTMVNEVYAKADIQAAKGEAQSVLESRMKDIEKGLREVIKDDHAKIKVQRWYPGVVEEITESIHEKTGKGASKINLEQRLLNEAAMALDKRQSLQVLATTEKTVDEILSKMADEVSPQPVDLEQGPTDLGSMVKQSNTAAPTDPRPQRRRRQKMRSTPVVGGSLFDKPAHEERKQETPTSKGSGRPAWKSFQMSGNKAEIVVNGESYDIRISDTTLKALRTGFSGDTLDSSAISVQPDRANVASNLRGYIRNNQLGMIAEEENGDSETSSVTHTKKPGSSGDTAP